MKNIFKQVLQGESVAVPPVWMMRQAGRYHSHYQALKQKYTFMDLCLVPELAAEVAMGPVQDFDFDAAILFSDILFPLKALGMPLDYTDQGPQLGFQLDAINIKKLKAIPEAIEEMSFQNEALKITRSRLPAHKGLIGFVGGPWTLFVYAMEGSHAGNLLRSKTSWAVWSEFSKIIESFLTENIKLQLAGGADVVMLFDTAAGELSPALFRSQLQPVLKNLIEKFPNKLGYYSKGTTADFFDESWKALPWLGQGYDHRQNLIRCLKDQPKGFVQGNFDQSLLHLPNSEFETVFRDYLKPFTVLAQSERKNWICGLGHGILPKTPEQNVRRFVQITREVLGGK